MNPKDNAMVPRLTDKRIVRFVLEGEVYSKSLSKQWFAVDTLIYLIIIIIIIVG